MLKPIDKAQLALAKKREQGEVSPKLNPIEKSQKKPKSLRLAVNAKCFDCSNHQRTEITKCTVRDCPLWAVRPYQKKCKCGSPLCPKCARG